VALPVSIGLVIIIHGLRIYAGGQSVRAAFQGVMWNLSALALVALPWILTLSHHYGSPTFSTSASINHALVGPGDQSLIHVFIRSHLAHPPGRITTWEDPDPKLDGNEWKDNRGYYPDGLDPTGNVVAADQISEDGNQ
jgi:hypothetical protein